MWTPVFLFFLSLTYLLKTKKIIIITGSIDLIIFRKSQRVTEMKIGIRVKLIALLTVVALLPLIAAILTIAIGGRNLRSETIGQNILSVASSEATALGVSLKKDIEKLHVALQHNLTIIDELSGRDVEIPMEEVLRLESRWAEIEPSQKPLNDILSNEIALHLNLLQKNDPRFVEILVTDRFGQLAGATGKTTDFYQADEEWWNGVLHNSKGSIFIPEINYDKSSGVWAIDISFPIKDENQQMVGVVKGVLDISQWLGSDTRPIGDLEASLMLVIRGGVIIYRHDIEPLTQRASFWSGDISKGIAGWRVTPDHQIQAFVPIKLPRKFDELGIDVTEWILVLSIAEFKALGDVYRLSAIVLAIGLVIIGFIFLAGFLLADRGIIRRVRILGSAAKKVAKGDLTHRVDTRRLASRMKGQDEIDDLARDFNVMIRQIQSSHNTLRQANELKTNFIRIASHELRTPVSYILAMLNILRDSEDVEKLKHSLEMVALKTRRLDEIIGAMFKLMPDQRFGEQLHYTSLAVSDIIEEIYLDVLPFLEKRRQRLVVEPCSDLPRLQADREKLKDAIENLVMNAIKFTPDGGEVRIKPSRQLGDRISIKITDQGPGIPESDVPHLFEPFFSGGDVLKHSTGESGYQKRGMGLGLAIVRHFIEMQGGDVRVSSSPQGSSFVITIPIEPPMRDGRPHEPNK